IRDRLWKTFGAKDNEGDYGHYRNLPRSNPAWHPSLPPPEAHAPAIMCDHSFHQSSLRPCTNLVLLLVYLSLIHISEPTRRTPISYAVFCLKKKKKTNITKYHA